MMQVLRRILAIGIVMSAVVLNAAPAAAAVAMVTDLQGKAVQSGEGRTRELSILSDLDAGAQVQIQSGASLTVLYLE